MRAMRRWGLVGLLAVACTPMSVRPAVAPSVLVAGDALMPLPPPALERAEGPLTAQIEVLSKPQEGRLLARVRFNRPMRGLIEERPAASLGVATSPAVAGRWRWRGRSEVEFQASGSLAVGAVAQIVVPAGLSSLDGATLEREARASFEREAFKLTTDTEDEALTQPDEVLSLGFNDDVDLSGLAEAVRLVEVGPGEQERRWPARVEASRARVTVAPQKPLRPGLRYEVRVSGELKSKRGAKIASGASLRFVVPDRLTASLACAQAASGAQGGKEGACVGLGAALTLSMPVRLGELRQALRVEPAVALRVSDGGVAKGSARRLVQAVQVGGAFEPGKSYRFWMERGAVREKGGRALAEALEQRLAFVPDAGAIQIEQAPEPYTPPSKQGWKLRVDDEQPLRVSSARLAGEQLWEFWRGGGAEGAGALWGRLSPSAPREVAPVDRVAWVSAESVAPRGAGAFLVQARRKDGAGEAQWLELRRPALLVLGRLGVGASVLWVTDARSGKAVEGAQVEVRALRDKTLSPRFSGQTGAGGVLEIPAGKLRVDDEVGVMARRGDDEALVTGRLEDVGAAWQGGMVTDRPVYLPGEVVRVRGLLSKAVAGLGEAAGKRIELTLYGVDSGRSGLAKATAVVGPRGTFSAELKLPEAIEPGSLGSYQVRASVRGEQGAEASLREAIIELREFRKPEFEVGSSLTRSEYMAGDELRCEASASYLSGEPLRGRKATARFSAGPTRPPFEAPEGFALSGVHPRAVYLASIGGEAFEPLGPEWGSPSAALDDAGHAALSIRAPELALVHEVACDVEVIDAAHQSLSGRSLARVHPAEVYLALKAPSSVDERAALRPEVMALTTAGKPAAATAVELELVRLERRKVKEGKREVERVLRSSAGRCSLTAGGASAASCALGGPTVGDYAVVARASDRRGRKVEVELPLSVTRARRAEQARAARPADPGVTLTLAPGPRTPGGRLRAWVTTDFPRTQALLTLERGGVLWKKSFELQRGEVEVEVPLPEGGYPRADLVLVSQSSWPDKVRERPWELLPGYASERIEMSGLAAPLSVSVKASAERVKPGATVDVEVQVAGARGEPLPAEVTLYAADEGALALGAWQVPDARQLLPGFAAGVGDFGESRVAFDWESLLRGGAGAGRAIVSGGGSVSGGRVQLAEIAIMGRQDWTGLLNVRADLSMTPCYHAALPTDARGQLRASCKLSQALSSFRLIAVAVARDADLAGAGFAPVRTSLPLSVRPALPRVVRAGDRFDAGVVVVEGQGRALDLEVRVEASGQLRTEAVPRRLSLAPFGQAEVSVPVEALGVGSGEVRLLAGGEGLPSDGVEIRLPVEPPFGLEQVARSGELTGAGALALGDLRGVRQDAGGLSVRASASALSGLYGGLEQLIEYPYGCTEQLTSRLVPLVVLRELAQAAGLSLPEGADEAAQQAVVRLLGHQHPDGGFGLWANSPEDTWLTAYAVWGLWEAKQRGLAVDAQALALGIDALTHAGSVLPGTPQEVPFVLDVLTTVGRPWPVEWDALPVEKLSLGSRAMLLRSLAAAGRKEQAAALGASLAERVAVRDGVASVAEEADASAMRFDSPARTAALLLRGFVALDPQHPLSLPLARAVLEARRGGRWGSTQEAAWALLALDAFRRSRPPADEAGGALQLVSGAVRQELRWKGAADVASAQVPLAALAPSVSLSPERGAYYEARLSYAPAAAPAAPRDEGLLVTRIIERLGDRTPGRALASAAEPLSGLALGDTALVTVLFEARRELRDVAVDVPLPGGLEPLEREVLSDETAQRQRYADDCVEPFRPLRGALLHEKPAHRELRRDRALAFLDRVPAGVHRFSFLARASTSGSFRLPPARVEAMYGPERGASVGGVFEVRRP